MNSSEAVVAANSPIAQVRLMISLYYTKGIAIQTRDDHRSFDKTCYHEISNFYTYKIN